ncbi:MAG: hypothetical protein WC864_04920 [Ilumatobacteraceae bacterium]
MTTWRLVAVALGHARRRIVLSLASFLIAALAAGAVVYLIGDSSQRSNQLLDTLNSPEVRSITLRANSDTLNGDLLPENIVRNIAMLPGVEQALGLSKVQSASVANVTDDDASVGYFVGAFLNGETRYQLTSGRHPQFGEAVASENAVDRLRLTVPSASQILVRDALVPVVGTFTASSLGAITNLLNTSVFSPAIEDQNGYFILVLIVRQPSDVVAVVEAARILLTEFGVSRYTSEYDPRAAEVELLVAKAGRSGARSTALAIVALAGLIEAAVAFMNAVLQRREIARRRALGFTRGMVFGVLVIEGAALSGVGAAIGSLTATIVLASNKHSLVFGQPIAAACFMALIGVIAALPGGALGAFQDPARILRVP